MITEFEAGVRELVARLRDFERRLKKTEDDAGSLEQFVKLITPGYGFAAPVAATNTTIGGTVKGCGSLGWPTDATVVVQDATTLAVLDTVTVDASGNYTSNIFLSANTSCKITATITGTYAARFVATAIISTITAGTANTGRNVSVGIASSYLCYSGCQFPPPKALTMIDGVYGTFAATNWSNGVNATVNFAGSGSCPAAANVGVTWTLAPGGGMLATWHAFGTGGTGNCPQSGAITSNAQANGTPVSLQCDPFKAVFTVSGLLWGGTVAAPGTATITWKE
jgi:hypothetical protein